MQLVVMLGQMIQSGKMTVSTKNKDDIEIVAVDKRIDINAKNKQFIKDIMASIRESSRKDLDVSDAVKESPEILKNARNMRDLLIDVADELKGAGITITLSYKGDVVATIGAQASSRLSRLITGTKAVEINSLPKLIELGLKTSF
jgi:hypothetical protein